MSEIKNQQSGEIIREAMPVLDYAILSNGDVTRTTKDGTDVVAIYDAKTKVLEIVEEFASYRSAVVRWMNANETAIQSIIMQGDKVDSSKGVIPPCPKPTMSAGDKTPAIVEWFRKYKPAEYRARYGVKGPGTVTKFRIELNERGEKVKVPYTVDATIAERKTHLTEKVEAADAQEGQYAAE
jgi:hypothetical protein